MSSTIRRRLPPQVFGKVMFGQGGSIRTFITHKVTPQCNTHYVLRDYNSYSAEKAAIFGDDAKHMFGG